MDICEQCDGRTFEFIDGTNYCTTCQTESKRRVFEHENYDNMQMYHTKIGKQTIKKMPKERLEKALIGRPWQTVEAFTVIIRAQVDALISLGADPKLEEVTFKIWTMYCKKNGSGFSQKNDPQTYLKGRDFDPGTIKEPFPRPLRFLPDFYSKYNAKDKEMSSSDSDDSDVEMDTEFGSVSGCSKHMTSSERYHAYYTIGIMTMQKTLAIVYLSLLYTRNSVQPCDLIYYVNTGQIPYTHNCWSLLPADMVIGLGDRQTFLTQNVPKAPLLRFYTGLIADYLDMTSLPHVNLKHLVSRYIVELNLPGELHDSAHRLLDRHPYSEFKPVYHRHKKALPYAEIALSYLVILLKLMFCLNDIIEHELTTFARSISSLITLAPPLFVWQDWQLYLDQMLNKKNSEWLDKESDYDDLSVKDSIGLFHDLDTSNKPVRQDSNRKSYRQKYDQWLQKLENPLREIFLSEQSEILESQPTSDTKTPIAKVNEKIMKTHTLAYITNPNFLEENKHLLREDDNFSELPDKSDASRIYFTNEKNSNNTSNSLKWLICSFATHINSSSRELNKYVCIIENLLFEKKSNISTTAKHHWSSYNNLNFKERKLNKPNKNT